MNSTFAQHRDELFAIDFICDLHEVCIVIFLKHRLGAPTWIFRGISHVFKRFSSANLLTFLEGLATSGDQPVVPVGFYLPNPTLYLAMRVITAWTGATMKALTDLFKNACCIAWKPTTFEYARLSLVFLCWSHLPQLPRVSMKALGGFFMRYT